MFPLELRSFPPFLLTFRAERMRLQATFFREIQHQAIWRQGSVVTADIDLQKTPSGPRCFENVKATATKKKDVKISELILLFF